MSILLRILLFKLSSIAKIHRIFQCFSKILPVHSINLSNKKEYKLFNVLLEKL